MKTPKLVELNPADAEALLERVEKGALQEGDYEIIKAIVEALACLSQARRRLGRTLLSASIESSTWISIGS